MPPFLAEFLQTLAGAAPAVFFRTSTFAYASLNACHIFSIGLVIGSIAALDLRLLGLFHRFPVSALAAPLTRVAATGLYFVIVTGFLLFCVRPLAYAVNPAFLAKLTLVGLGVINALALRTSRGWALALENELVPDSVRAAALRSILIWAGAVFAGRWIGFLQ